MNYVANFIRRPRGAAFAIGGETTRMYVEGNHLDDGAGGDDPKSHADPWKIVKDAKPANRMNAPFPVEPVSTESAKDAFEAVLRVAGATLPGRDAVDRRVVAQVRNGTGGLIDSQKQVGGWPALESREAPADADNDGMADAWERLHRLDVAAADHNGDEDRDGYTNLEEHLNGTDPRGAD
jgi:hypothetical protein